MRADAVIVFDKHHCDAVTQVLGYWHWNLIVLSNKIALDEDGNMEDTLIRPQLYIVMWLNTLKTIVNDR